MGRENLQRLDANRCHELALDRSADAHIRVLVRTNKRLADEGIRAPLLRFMGSGEYSVERTPHPVPLPI